MQGQVSVDQQFCSWIGSIRTQGGTTEQDEYRQAGIAAQWGKPLVLASSRGAG